MAYEFFVVERVKNEVRMVAGPYDSAGEAQDRVKLMRLDHPGREIKAVAFKKQERLVRLGYAIVGGDRVEELRKAEISWRSGNVYAIKLECGDVIHVNSVELINRFTDAKQRKKQG